jgi:uncharacterized membrane protein
MKKPLLIIVLIILLGSALRIWELGKFTYWFDEVHLAALGVGDLRESVALAYSHEWVPPLDYIFTHLFARWVSTDESILRLLPVLWGLCTIALVYAIGSRWFNPTVGLTAALLIAILPIHVFMSRELRYYSLGVFTATLSTWLLSIAARTNRSRDWLLYGASVCAALYSAYLTIPVLMAHALWMLFVHTPESRSLKTRFAKFGVVYIIAVFSFVPWVVLDVLFDRSTLDFTYVKPDLGMMFISQAYLPQQSIQDFINWEYTPTASVWALFASTCAIGLLCFCIVQWRHRKSWIQHDLLIALIWFVAFAAPAVLTQVLGYSWVPRQQTFVTPFLVLSVAVALYRVSLFLCNRFTIKPAVVFLMACVASGLI